MPTLLQLAVLATAATSTVVVGQPTCDVEDISARAIVVRYLGEDIPDWSLYNTTKLRREEQAASLQSFVLGVAGGEQEFSMDFLIDYGMSQVGYVVPGVLSLLFLLFFGLPLFFARCCCPRCCCKPHHPLIGQENGTLADYPHPGCCCGCSRSTDLKPSKNPDVVDKWNGDMESKKEGQQEGDSEKVVLPYTWWQSYSPTLFYGAFAFCLLFVCVSGPLAVGSITSGLQGAVCAVDTLLVDTISFMDGIGNALSDMLLVAVTSLDNVGWVVGNSSSIAAGASEELAQGLDATARIDALTARAMGTYSFDSAAVTDALTSLNESAALLDETFESVSDLIVEPRNTIVEIAEALNGIFNSTDFMFADLNYTLHGEEIEIPAIPFLTTGEPYHGYLSLLTILSDNPHLVGSPFFILAFLSVPFTIFGILVMGPKCAHKQHDKKSQTTWQCCGLLFSRLSCCTLYLTILVACIPALILFPIAVVLADGCSMLEAFAINNDPFLDALLPAVEATGPTTTAAATSTNEYQNGFEFNLATAANNVVDACFDDQSLLEALNITDTLYAYVQSVDFSEVTALDVASLVDVNQLNTQIDALTESSDIYTILSPFDSDDQTALETTCNTCSSFGAAAAAMNHLPFYPTTITNDDVTAMDACSDCSTGTATATNSFTSTGGLPGGNPQMCATWQAAACELAANVTSLAATLTSVQAEFRQVKSGIQQVNDNVTAISGLMDDVISNITGLSSSVYGLNDYARCGFIADFYGATVTSLCPGSTAGMLWLGYSLNILLIGSICAIVCIILFNCRLGGVGQPRHHSRIKNFLPTNIPKFFNGGHSNSRVAPVMGKQLSKKEEEEATAFIAQSKAEDRSAGIGDNAGVAM